MDFIKGLRDVKKKMKDSIASVKSSDLGSGAAYHTAEAIKKRKRKLQETIDG